MTVKYTCIIITDIHWNVIKKIIDDKLISPPPVGSHVICNIRWDFQNKAWWQTVHLFQLLDCYYILYITSNLVKLTLFGQIQVSLLLLVSESYQTKCNCSTTMTNKVSDIWKTNHFSCKPRSHRGKWPGCYIWQNRKSTDSQTKLKKLKWKIQWTDELLSHRVSRHIDS